MLSGANRTALALPNYSVPTTLCENFVHQTSHTEWFITLGSAENYLPLPFLPAAVWVHLAKPQHCGGWDTWGSESSCFPFKMLGGIWNCLSYFETYLIIDYSHPAVQWTSECMPSVGVLYTWPSTSPPVPQPLVAIILFTSEVSICLWWGMSWLSWSDHPMVYTQNIPFLFLQFLNN